METLKKLFPLSFKRVDEIKNLIIGIIIYLVVGVLAGAVLWLSGVITGWIPVIGLIVGWALGIIGTVVEVYVIAGIVIQILVYAKIIKE